MEDDDIQRWETTNKVWNNLKVGADGKLFQSRETEQWRSEANLRRFELRNKARGLIRSIVLIIDLSESGLSSRDYGCSRIQFLKQSLSMFVTDFFEQNPISQISIISASNGRSRILTSLCGDVDIHLKCIDKLGDYVEEGIPSIHNAMHVAVAILKSAAMYSTREVLMVYGSLNCCDNAPIDPILKNLKLNKVVVNIIGLGASVFILDRLSRETEGRYLVPLNVDHFNDILKANIEPPEWTQGFERFNFIPFGFVQNNDELPSFDITEIRSKNEALPRFDGYACPKCKFHVFAIPSYCPSCGILLLTPNHITQTKFHLVSVPPFHQVDINRDVKPNERKHCSSCCVSDNDMYQCPRCLEYFCKDCDSFIHNSLNRCPSCTLADMY